MNELGESKSPSEKNFKMAYWIGALGHLTMKPNKISVTQQYLNHVGPYSR